MVPSYQDHFGTYICNANSELASIFLNIGLYSVAPMTGKPCLLWVFVYLQNPRHDGLSDGGAAPTLYAIEDRLNAELIKSCIAIACGRITTLGRREYYFYAPSDKGFAEAVNAALEVHPAYAFNLGHQTDPTWNQYLNVLYPPPDALDSIANWDVLDSLAKNGDDPSVPRSVDHFLHLPSRQSARLCRIELEAEGFTFEAEHERDGDLPFILHVTKCQSIESEHIDATTRRLRQISVKFNGEYDGWGCVATSLDPPKLVTLSPMPNPLPIPPRSYKAYLFDLDGTVADSMPLHFVAWSKAVAEAGGQFPEPLFYQMGGIPLHRTVELLNERFNTTMDPAAVVHRKENLYLDMLADLKPVASVLAHVEAQSGKIPFAIVSGSPRASILATLAQLGLTHHFPVIVGAEDYTHGKPSPEPFLKAAALLQVEPKDCLVFEDAEAGIESAKAAGIDCVRIPPPTPGG